MLGVSDSTNGVNHTAIIKLWQSDPANWFGPFFISIPVDLFFFGVLCNQVWNYYLYFPRDSHWIKRLVALASFASLLKTIQSFLVVWEKSILGFGNWADAVTMTPVTWLEALSAAMVSSIAQVFFVWRCYVLTGRNTLLLVFLIATMLAVLVLSVGLSHQVGLNAYDGHAVGRWAIPMTIANIMLDFTITIIVSYKLYTSRQSGSRNTDDLVWKLLSITWESALPPAFCQVVNMVVHFVTLGKWPMWNYMNNTVTPRLYVFSLMYTLNCRVDMRKYPSSQTTARYAHRTEPSVELSEIQFRRHLRDSGILFTCNCGHQAPVLEQASRQTVGLQKENDTTVKRTGVGQLSGV